MTKRVFKIKKEKKQGEILKKEKDKVLKFPQISRFINARFFYNAFIGFLASGILGVLAFNYLYPSDTFEKAKINLYLRPYDPKSYMSLADLYLGLNDYESAKRELNNALFFAKDESLKAEATRRILLIERSQKTRRQIEQEIVKWEKVIAEKQNYRDAYFRLAVLYYQIFNNDKARQYLYKAMALDPNFEEGKRLRELL